MLRGRVFIFLRTTQAHHTFNSLVKWWNSVFLLPPTTINSWHLPDLQLFEATSLRLLSCAPFIPLLVSLSTFWVSCCIRCRCHRHSDSRSSSSSRFISSIPRCTRIKSRLGNCEYRWFIWSLCKANGHTDCEFTGTGLTAINMHVYWVQERSCKGAVKEVQGPRIHRNPIPLCQVQGAYSLNDALHQLPSLSSWAPRLLGPGKISKALAATKKFHYGAI